MLLRCLLLLGPLPLLGVLPSSARQIPPAEHPNAPQQYWPSLSLPDKSPLTPSALVQENSPPASWSVSYTGPSGDQIRPSHRYIFQGVRFAQPPDPHKALREQQQKDSEQALESFVPKAEIPQALRNYFALDVPPEKVLKEFTGVDLRSLLGPSLDEIVPTTPTPTWTRATTPKDKLVEYFERSLDHFLSGKYRPMERIPYLLEKEKLLEMNTTNPETDTMDDEDSLEGSGQDEEPIAQPRRLSSIAGIPKQMPFIPKVPADFTARQQDAEIVSKIVELRRPPVDDRQREIRRHPAVWGQGPEALAKTEKEHFQYDAKPSYQQGVVSTLLNFLGISSVAAQSGTDLDRVLTEWILDHAPRHSTKVRGGTASQTKWPQSQQGRRLHDGESSYSRMQRLLSAPLTPLCSPQPEVMANFSVDALMGQWFEVMYSPLLSSPVCTVLSYDMLSRSSQPAGVGSVFQTLQFSSPNRVQSLAADLAVRPLLNSGYAIVARPGQMAFKRSNSPEEIVVHVLDAGYSARRRRYEYAILGINCNYPLYVIARDPFTFKQKYEKTVVSTLERKGLVNDVSKLLNIVTALNPAQCQMPAHFFAGTTFA